MSEDMGSVGQLSAGISETTISGMYYLKGGVHQSAYGALEPPALIFSYALTMRLALNCSVLGYPEVIKIFSFYK